jgi:CRISPR/Cas system-associated exonuclease Cas4 (RecB family)
MKLAIHDLDVETSERIEVEHDDNAREQFRAELQGWIKGVRQGVFDPIEDRSICPECDFRRFCRYAPEEALRN